MAVEGRPAHDAVQLARAGERVAREEWASGTAVGPAG